MRKRNRKLFIISLSFGMYVLQSGDRFLRFHAEGPSLRLGADYLFLGQLRDFLLCHTQVFFEDILIILAQGRRRLAYADRRL